MGLSVGWRQRITFASKEAGGSMNARATDNWRADFGIDSRRNPNFLSSKDDLTGTRAQAHVLRHAFDLLGLDGILCSGNTPLIYFKQVDEIKTDGAAAS
jgi:hypothetical protein